MNNHKHFTPPSMGRIAASVIIPAIAVVALGAVVAWALAPRAAHGATLAQQIVCLEYGINNSIIGNIVTLDPGFDCPSGYSTTTQAVLTVVKHVVNAGGGTATANDFTMRVAGTNASSSLFPGSEAGTIVTLDPGGYSVSEDASSTYAMSLGPNCSGVMTSGEVATCTVTNTYVATSTPPAPMADISVTKSVSTTTPVEGSDVSYAITVHNGGPDAASGVAVTDALPAGVTYVSDDGGGSYSTSTHVWMVGALVDGASDTLHISASVDGGTAGEGITNTASATSTTMDPNPSNNTSAPVVITPIAPTPQPGQGLLTIVKHTNGGDGTFDFSVVATSTATSTVSLTTVNGAATSTPLSLSPGTYDVTEDVPSGWSLSNVACREQEGGSVGTSTTDGVQVAIGDGDIVTCTFADGRPSGQMGGLDIMKTISGGTATSSDFMLHVLSGDADVAGSPQPGSATGTPYLLSAGSYTVSESGGPANYTASFSGDCNATGTVAVTAGATSTCSVLNTYAPPATQTTATPPVTGNGNNGPIVGTLGALGAGGQVLGASTTTAPTTVATSPAPTCGPLLTTYLRRGQSNDPAEVTSLQQFLNQEDGANLPVTGFFGPLTEAAVNAFQLRHSANVLEPWLPYGLPSSSTPTGYVYKTTQREINLMYCRSLNIPMPVLP